jgi:hypothetical protein
MKTITVVLPNGVKLRDVPENTPKSVIQDLAISNGLASAGDFGVNTPNASSGVAAANVSYPSNPRRRGSTVPNADQNFGVEDVGEYLKDNMGLPLGMAASGLGAVLGSPLGPGGMIAGAALLGAAGSGGGSLLSDKLNDEELNFAKAVNEAVISLGFDAATLGLGKILRPTFVAARMKLGLSPEETAREIVKDVAPVVGSKQSLAATQDILEPYKASLTPSQVGATGTRLMQEKLARVGLVSSLDFAKNVDAINKAAQDGLNEVANRFVVESSGSPMEVAEQLIRVIDTGKSALTKIYGESLDELAMTVPNTVKLGMKGHNEAIDAFLAKNTEGGFVDLSPAALKFIEKDLRQGLINKNVETNLKGLIILDKQLTRQIKEKFGTPGTKTYSADAERQLSDLASSLREATYSVLNAAKPEAGAQYKKLKAAYAEGYSGLAPIINKGFVTKAGANNYSAIGRVLANAGNPSQIIQFKNQLKQAYKEIGEDGVEELSVKSFDEADALLKRVFVEAEFPTISSQAFEITKYQNYAQKLSSPQQQDRYKAILGEDFAKVNQLVNLMSEASKTPTGSIGELMLRNKEYSAIAQLSGGFAGGGLLGAGAVLFIPSFLAKLSLNRKAVNSLIAFDNRTFKNDQEMEAALGVIIADVLDAMTDEEQAEIRNYFRTANLKDAEANPN